MNPVKIEYEKDDIYEKSDSDKLNFLIDIAFSNHQQLVKQGLTLYGNGDSALQEKISGYCYLLTDGALKGKISGR